MTTVDIHRPASHKPLHDGDMESVLCGIEKGPLLRQTMTAVLILDRPPDRETRALGGGKGPVEAGPAPKRLQLAARPVDPARKPPLHHHNGIHGAGARRADRFDGETPVFEEGIEQTWQGWLYLATVIDCFNREVIGTLDTPRESTVGPAALQGAMTGRARRHSDQAGGLAGPRAEKTVSLALEGHLRVQIPLFRVRVMG